MGTSGAKTITAPNVRPGDVISGKYRVERIIGAGGMGTVVAATHLQLEQCVAIKLMLPNTALLPEAVERFVREGRAAAKLRSEHAGRVFDVDVLESGEPYIVMEYLEGHDIASLLQARGPVGITDTVDWIMQACEAVAEAHGAGIIHRDLKPSNLFLTTDPYGANCVKVIDFGISKMSSAKEQGAQAGEITGVGAFLGSPMYMSPEQMRNARDTDARADIWALGCITYEMLTGRPAWPGDSVSEICAKILTDPAPRARDLRVDVAAELDEVIAGCLEKDRAHRTATVREFAGQLAPFGSSSCEVSSERLGFRRSTPTRPLSGVSSRRSPVSGQPEIRISTGRNAIPGVNTAAAWGQMNTGDWWRSYGPRSSRTIGALIGASIVAAIVAIVVVAKVRRSEPSVTSPGVSLITPVLSVQRAQMSATNPATIASDNVAPGEYPKAAGVRAFPGEHEPPSGVPSADHLGDRSSNVSARAATTSVTVPSRTPAASPAGRTRQTPVPAERGLAAEKPSQQPPSLEITGGRK